MSSKFKSTLLFLTSTFNDIIQNSRTIIEHSFRHTKSDLFIHVAPHHTQLAKSRVELRTLFAEFYATSLKLDPHVNVVCLLHNSLIPCVRSSPIQYDLVLTDLKLDNHIELSIRDYLASISTSSSSYEIRSIESSLRKGETNYVDESTRNRENDLIAADKSYDNSILGGTFDRIHNGHKLLLVDTLLLTKKRLLVGLADGPLLVKKKLAELIEDATSRERHLRALVSQMRPDIELIVEPIHDPYGPSITEPDYQCLVVSEETKSGGDAVNTKRIERGLSPLDLHVARLVTDIPTDSIDEPKVSSSNERRRLLGTLLKPPRRPAVANEPYLIGLTGGLASGKSAILNDLAQLGAGVIDCDKLGHQVYVKNTPGYHRLVETFGTRILTADDGSIDRKELGKLVFEESGKSGLKKLTDIVWPEVRRMVDEESRRLFDERGCRIVVVEAPLLIEAGWAENMNETWVVFVPPEEALRRAMKRDGSDEEKVRGILSSQLDNKQRIKHAHVVFSSIWEREYTIKQVKKAWDSLLQRI